MSTARSAIEDAIEYALDRQLSTGGTATSGTTLTVVDTGRPSSGEDFTHFWIHIDTTTDSLAPQSEEREVSVYTASSQTFTVPIAFTVAPASGDTYSVRRALSKKHIDDAINFAIERGNAYWVDVQTDETIRIIDETLEYTLPTGCKQVYQAWLRSCDSDDSGTATAGASTTLTDSGKDWDTNEHASKELVIWKGTGASQYRTISSNTATVLTVSVAWTTNPDTTSEYYIKDVTEAPGWTRLYACQIDIAGGEIRFASQLTEGEALRIIYHKDYSALTTDALTTNMPVTYIVYAALAHLYTSLVAQRDRREEAGWLVGFYQAEADKYASTHKQITPTGTMWHWTGGSTGWDYPSPFR